MGMPPAKRSRTQEPPRAESAHATSSVADEDSTAATAAGSAAVAGGAYGAAAAAAAQGCEERHGVFFRVLDDSSIRVAVRLRSENERIVAALKHELPSI